MNKPTERDFPKPNAKCSVWTDCLDRNVDFLQQYNGASSHIQVYLELNFIDDKSLTNKQLRAFKVFTITHNTEDTDQALYEANWEAVITRWLGELEIGAEVLNIHLTKDKTQLVIVSARYDGSLYENSKKFDKNPENFKILEAQLDKLYTKLAMVGLYCSDLRPQNIVLNFNGDNLEKVRLIDFDLFHCQGMLDEDIISDDDRNINVVAHKIICQWNSWYTWKSLGYEFKPLFSDIHEHEFYSKAINKIIEDEETVQLMAYYTSKTNVSDPNKYIKRALEDVKDMLQTARDTVSPIDYRYPKLADDALSRTAKISIALMSSAAVIALIHSYRKAASKRKSRTSTRSTPKRTLRRASTRSTPKRTLRRKSASSASKRKLSLN